MRTASSAFFRRRGRVRRPKAFGRRLSDELLA
jgi:hypothetical protein